MTKFWIIAYNEKKRFENGYIMIIVFSEAGELNQRAVKALVAKRPQEIYSLESISNRAKSPLFIDPTDTTLTIIELNANGNMQEKFSPKIMTQRLQLAGILAPVCTIQLLISDVSKKKSLLTFATELSEALQIIKPNSDITVRVLRRPEQCTLIEPPAAEEPDGDWTIYIGAHPTGVQPSKEGAFQYYQEKLTPLYIGDIEKALQAPEYDIFPEPANLKRNSEFTLL